MSGPVSDVVPATVVGRFADGILVADLPRLDAERRSDVVRFVERRVAGLPSVTRAGVRIVGGAVHALGLGIGHERAQRLVAATSLPLVGEYPRLVRSLGYAYVWETWPDTRFDGAAPVASAR